MSEQRKGRSAGREQGGTHLDLPREIGRSGAGIGHPPGSKESQHSEREQTKGREQITYESNVDQSKHESTENEMDALRCANIGFESTE